MGGLGREDQAWLPAREVRPHAPAPRPRVFAGGSAARPGEVLTLSEPVEVTVDALPDENLHGVIDSISPASGAQFALLPPDNATGNFNKVVQRVPVKVLIDSADVQRLGSRLRLGYSVIVDIRVR